MHCHRNFVTVICLGIREVLLHKASPFSIGLIQLNDDSPQRFIKKETRETILNVENAVFKINLGKASGSFRRSFQPRQILCKREMKMSKYSAVEDELRLPNPGGQGMRLLEWDMEPGYPSLKLS